MGQEGGSGCVFGKLKLKIKRLDGRCELRNREGEGSGGPRPKRDFHNPFFHNACVIPP
jgi:hypothetical protein